MITDYCEIVTTYFAAYLVKRPRRTLHTSSASSSDIFSRQ